MDYLLLIYNIKIFNLLILKMLFYDIILSYGGEI